MSRLAQSTTASSGGSSGGDAAMQPGTSFTSAAAAAAQPAAYGSQARAPALQLGRSSPHSPSGDGGGSSSTSTSPKAPLQLVQHMRRCVATICGQEGSRACLETLALVLRNIVAKPDEPKYRQIKLSNAKIQQNVLTFDGPLELLEAAGFAMLPAAAAAAAAAPAGNGGGAAEGSSSGEEL